MTRSIPFCPAFALDVAQLCKLLYRRFTIDSARMGDFGCDLNWRSEQERQRTGALQDAPRHSCAIEIRASVLECGGPPPLLTAPVVNATWNHNLGDVQPVANPRYGRLKTCATIWRSEQERQRTGALQDAPRHSCAIEIRASVLGCGSPPPLLTAPVVNATWNHHPGDVQPVANPRYGRLKTCAKARTQTPGFCDLPIPGERRKL